MTDIQSLRLSSKMYVCHGNRTINGLLRHRGEVIDATGLRNMDILEEMSAVTRVADTIETVDIEHDGHVRSFIDDEHALVFADWVAAQAPAEEEVIEDATDADGADGNSTETEEEVPHYSKWKKADLEVELENRGIDYPTDARQDELTVLLEADDESDDTPT